MTSTYGPITTSGTVVSYLPLTTAWSAPTECSSLFLDTSGSLFINAPEYHNGVAGSPECVPPEVSIWWYQSLNSASPTGVVLGGYDFACPEAYTTVFSFYTSSTSTIGCCPSEYTYGGTWWQHGNPYQCSSTIPAGTITYVQAYTDTIYTTTSLYVSTPTIITGVQINGFRVETTPHTAQQTSSSTGLYFLGQPTSTTSSSVYGTATSAAVTNASGLNSQAKIGIGVGVSLGAIVLIGMLAIWLLMRRRRNRQSAGRHEAIIETSYAKPELDSAPAPMTNDTTIPCTKPALGSSPSPVKEMDSTAKIYELGSPPISQPVAELSSDAHPPALLTEAEISEMENRALEEETSGAYEAAEVTYRQVVQWRESNQGPEHPATLTSMYRLVLVLSNMRNKTGLADELYRELMIRRQTLPNPRPSSPLLGEALMLRGKSHEATAEKLIRQELDLNMRVLGPEHLLTLFSQGNLANVLRRQLKLEEAENAYRVTLEMSDKALGPLHAYSLQQINNLAVTLSMRDKNDEAREVYRQTLERNINKAGYNHPDTYPSLHNLKGKLKEDEDLEIAITTPRDGSLPQGQKHRATVKIVRRHG